MGRLTSGDYIQKTRVTSEIAEGIERAAKGEHFTKADATRWVLVKGLKVTGYWPESPDDPFADFLNDMEKEPA